MKIFKIAMALGLSSIGLAFGSSKAQALTFNWQFTTDSNSQSGAGQVIQGTISGLVNGSNSGSGTTVTVTSAPDANLVGTFSFFGSGSGFTVTGGNITSADAEYRDVNNNNLLDFESSSSEIYDAASNQDYSNHSNIATFTATTAAVPFEFSPEQGLALGTPIFISLGMLKKKLALKNLKN